MKELKKYQDIDIEVKKLEKKIYNSEYIKKINSSKETAKNSQLKMIELNEEARKILNEIDKIITVKQKGLELVKKYSETDLNTLNEDSVLEINNKVKPIRKNLDELIIRLNTLHSRLTAILEEFEGCRKQVISSKKLFDENKVLLDKLKADIEPQIEKVKIELQKQEKNIKPELFQKYRNMKRDGIFPVLVNLVDEKNCGYCRMEQSIHKLDNLKLNGYTECEQCHRIIINQD